MAKFGIFASIATIVAALSFASLTPADAADACHHTEFKTEMVKNACAKGGQPEAKAVMKKFMKEKKVKSCNKCHAKLAPTYDLKPDALKQFKELGGK
jgi:hypothetical protein